MKTVLLLAASFLRQNRWLMLAFVGWPHEHEHEHRQLVEIQGLLNARGVLLNARTVGKL